MHNCFQKTNKTLPYNQSHFTYQKLAIMKMKPKDEFCQRSCNENIDKMNPCQVISAKNEDKLTRKSISGPSGEVDKEVGQIQMNTEGVKEMIAINLTESMGTTYNNGRR